MPATPAWVALSMVEFLGGRKMRALLDHFDGDLNAIMRADSVHLRRVPGIGEKIAASILAIDLMRIIPLIERWQSEGVRLIAWDEPDYPSRLLALDDPPPTLYVRGDAPLHAEKSVAIVGTRQPTPESAEAARQIAFALAARGIYIISGLAHGIDAAAHVGALAAPNGITLAVLGGGVLNIYPPQNRALAGAILKRGALISEVPPFSESKPTFLVARNRLISGMCDALLVVETSAEGGAMHAARRALEQGRRVYVIDNGASGNLALLDEGAQVFSVGFEG